MRFRTWLMAAVALAGLLGLMAAFGVMTTQRSSSNFVELDALYRHYRDVEVRLHRLRGEVYLSGIFIRDYLLDTTSTRDSEYRAQLAAYWQSNLESLEQLSELIPGDGDAPAMIQRLKASVEDYWKMLEPVLDWTPAEKTTQGAAFLRSEVVPRREAVITIAREIENLNSASLEAENLQATRQYTAHFGDMRRLLWQTLGLGLIVATASVFRFRMLEQRAAALNALAEAAGERARILSQQVVATQEEERRTLSRELHDHVGQMLTGLRMQLGLIERLGADEPRVAPAIADSRSLVDKIMDTVRDLALGLRPSMLDDFGLQPALEWLVRDFARRSPVQATLTVSAHLGGLPESYRTCIFRGVQEALTNCARHSGASTVTVNVKDDQRGLTVVVRDNGGGIAADRQADGLGLRGIKERAEELNGTAVIETGIGTGTTVTIWLPSPPDTEAGDARITG